MIVYCILYSRSSNSHTNGQLVTNINNRKSETIKSTILTDSPLGFWVTRPTTPLNYTWTLFFIIFYRFFLPFYVPVHPLSQSSPPRAPRVDVPANDARFPGDVRATPDTRAVISVVIRLIRRLRERASNPIISPL